MTDRKEYQREYQKEYRKTMKGRERERRVRARRQAWLDSLKASPCRDCGGTFPPECMQFDHVRGKKHLGVTMLVWQAAKSTVLAEIKKCDLVCANCHAIRTKRRACERKSSR
jgi:hypothetical protein